MTGDPVRADEGLRGALCAAIRTELAVHGAVTLDELDELSERAADRAIAAWREWALRGGS